MTVKELKEQLERYSDTTEVAVLSEPRKGDFFYGTIIGNLALSWNGKVIIECAEDELEKHRI